MATREEAVAIAKGWQVWSEWWDRADSIGPEAGPQPEVPLDGDSVRIADALASALLALDERVRVLEGENEYVRTEAADVLDDNDRVRAHNEKLRQLVLAVQRFDSTGLKLWVCRHCMASGSLTEEDGDGAAAMHDRTCIKNPLVQERNALAREVEAKQTAIDALKLALDRTIKRAIAANKGGVK